MIDKEAFLKPRLPEAAVDIPGVGTARVRGLSRAEILAVQALPDTEAVERFVLLVGLVDPQLTAEEVAVWHAGVTTDEITMVMAAIKELSGLGDGAANAAYKSV
jgi:hypothetical protein